MKEVPIKTFQDGPYIIECYECCYCLQEVMDSSPRVSKETKTLCSDCAFEVARDLASTKGSGLGGAAVEWFFRDLIDEFFPHKRKALSKRIRLLILEKYKYTCNHCGGRDKLEIDHIKPYFKGGSSDPSNLQVLCKPCNIKKGSK